MAERTEEFIEFRPVTEGRNLVHWRGADHVTGPGCPCQPGARPHDGTVLDPDGDAIVIDDREPWVPRHNHFTRDVKPEGQCPGCDRHREVSR